MKFLKENWVLCVGFSLPLLLTLLFFMSTQIALSAIDPPRYSVVFYEDLNYGRTDDPYRLVVKGHQLYFQYFPLGAYDPKEAIWDLYKNCLSAIRGPCWITVPIDKRTVSS